MTNPSTIAASLTPKMREALEGRGSNTPIPTNAQTLRGMSERGLVDMGRLHRGQMVKFCSWPLTPLGLAVREALLEGKG